MSLDQLTDEEKHVLLTLSYVDLPNNQPLEGKNLEQIWQFARYNLDEEDDSYQTLNNFINDSDFKHSNLYNITLTGYENFNPNEGNNSKGKSDTGFVGYAFKDREENGVAMFRGSESLGNLDHLKTDWSSNVDAGFGIPIKQQQEANAFYHSKLGNLGGERLVLGHSKGGNLASYVFVHNLDDNLKSYVINAAPLYWWDLSREQKEALKGDRNSFIVFQLDPVSQLGFVPYVDKTVHTKPRDSIFQIFNPVYPHGLSSVGGFDLDGNFERWDEGSTWARDGMNYFTASLMFGISISPSVLKKKAEIFIQNITPFVLVTAAKGLTKAANTIKEETLKVISRIQTVTQELNSRIHTFFDEMIHKATSLGAGVAAFFAGGSAAAAEPVIKVDIGRLRYYAERLQNLKRRTAHLNDMVDSLYWEAGLLGLDNVLRADLRTSAIDTRITQSAAYLNRTAELMQRDEAYLLNRAGSVR
ncbi:Mbeg1-like protein [Mesobacillus foraminis]|uniref:Mbeg1-like protein n=1 Tax=Mesobacillus foraminis TaxID=279826 RepID=UPI000EF4BB83|nr:Mbeg1-like protein [Mesobacillus foraminis]